MTFTPHSPLPLPLLTVFQTTRHLMFGKDNAADGDDSLRTNHFNPLVAGAGGGEAVDATLNRFFKFFLRMGRAFTPDKIFSCNLILGTSVHEKIFQIGPTVLALKLDEGRVLWGEGASTLPWTFLPIFLTMKMTFSLNKFWYGVR